MMAIECNGTRFSSDHSLVVRSMVARTNLRGHVVRYKHMMSLGQLSCIDVGKFVFRSPMWDNCSQTAHTNMGCFWLRSGR